MIFADLIEWMLDVPEPLPWLRNLEIVAEGFLAYVAGVLVRHSVDPYTRGRKGRLRLQLLLAIPISLVVVPPLLYAVSESTSIWAYLVTMGVIMEHGMLLNETAQRHLEAINSKGRLDGASSAPA